MAKDPAERYEDEQFKWAFEAEDHLRAVMAKLVMHIGELQEEIERLKRALKELGD